MLTARGEKGCLLRAERKATDYERSNAADYERRERMLTASGEKGY